MSKQKANGGTTLIDKIVAALSETITSEAIGTLLIELSTGIQEASAALARVRERGLDPLEVLDANVARGMIETATFELERLQALLPRLQNRYAEIRASEEAAIWDREYNEAERRYLCLAEELASLYIAHAEPLVDLFRRIVETEEKYGYLNATAPQGEHRRLKNIELLARQLDSFSRDMPSILKDCTLPVWTNSSEKMWPPKPVSMATRLGMSSPWHPLGDWANPRYIEQRANEILAEQKRVAAFYEQQTIKQEERQNREEKERMQRRS
jgi:hypothetical protein